MTPGIDIDNRDYEAEWLKKIKCPTLAFRGLWEDRVGMSYRGIQNPAQKIWPGCLWWVRRLGEESHGGAQIRYSNRDVGCKYEKPVVSCEMSIAEYEMLSVIS